MASTSSTRPTGGYVLFLTDDKDAILSFFGFDTSITFNSFKQTYTRTSAQSKFNAFLKAKHGNRRHEPPPAGLQPTLRDAVRAFGKQEQYRWYKARYRPTVRALHERMALLRAQDSNGFDADRFRLFTALHGVLAVGRMAPEELVAAWTDFATENWSGLRFAHCMY